MSKKLSKDIYRKAYSLMCKARSMSDIYEENKAVTSKYVHATSKGHEAIQIAIGLQLTKNDWAAPYYRDDSMLLAIDIRAIGSLEMEVEKKSWNQNPFAVAMAIAL